MGGSQWTIPRTPRWGVEFEIFVRCQQLGRTATVDELRDLTKLLRTLETDIFQGGANIPSVSVEAERIRLPILNGWYKPLFAFGRCDSEQQRLFDKVGGLLSEIELGTAESPRERLASLAADVDKLVAKIDPQALNGGQVGADISKCPRPTMPTDPTTRDLIIALQEGKARGEKTEDINRDFLRKRAVPKNAVASLKRAARRFLLALKKWEGADT